MLKTINLPNSKALEVWKKATSTKNENRADNAHKVAANSITFLLGKNDLIVSAKHHKDSRGKSIIVHVTGGISTEAAICGLRLIAGVLEREGLPVQSENIEYRTKDGVFRTINPND
jgi:hypothetical protein